MATPPSWERAFGLRAGHAAAGFAVVTLAMLACAQGPAPAAAPPRISLAAAIRLARANSPAFQAAVADLGMARETQAQARDSLLPAVTYNNQYLYTQGGTKVETPRFIANNAVHEYVSQGQVHEDLFAGGARWAAVARAHAGAALALAQLEIASRGLAATVTGDYYALLAAERKTAAATQGVTDAQRFVQITDELERGGQAAHADVIKAQLQLQAARRAEQEAALASEQNRLNLAVLLSPRFDENFSLVDDLTAVPTLPGFERAADLAGRANPQLQAAVAATREAQADVTIARAGFFPTLSFDYWYGIDAPNLATHFDAYYGRVPNLGFSAAATLTIPVWNWGATASKVKQAELQRGQAEVQLSYTQRSLVANLHALYAEAATAEWELASLGQSAQLAAESERLTVLRYEAGEATVLEVIDAQTSLIQARDALVDGEARYHTARANLQSLTGPF